MKQPAPISFNEVMREMDKYQRVASNKKILTEEQKKFLLKVYEKRISYTYAIELWERAGWGKIGRWYFSDYKRQLIDEKRKTAKKNMQRKNGH